MPTPLLVIACGAIARELVRIKRANGWEHIDFQCLPPALHNSPRQLTDAVEHAIEAARDRYDRVFVAYGDCGTGGMLDLMLKKQGVERLPGPHCYEFIAGNDVFAQMAAAEAGSFYLTDFLVVHFKRLVIDGLGLDRHPQLLPQYFSNYRRVVYLAQTQSEELQARAREHAGFLGLDYRYHFCGDQPLARALAQQA